MAVYRDTNGDDEKVHTKTSYFQLFRPPSVAGTGLFEGVRNAVLSLGITEFSAEHCTKLISIGTDGASANIAKEGLSLSGPLAILFQRFSTQQYPPSS